MKRSASAVWQGTGKEGNGTISSQSGVVNNAPYSWNTRFQEVSGTSPEELIAAAHAACYSMKLSFVIVAGGSVADKIETSCTVTIENGAITNSHLAVKASVPGASQDQLKTWADDAKANCPVSKALNATITLELLAA